MVAGHHMAHHRRIGQLLQTEFADQSLQHIHALLHMGLHQSPLLRVQASRFEQDVVGNADLADVVQW